MSHESDKSKVITGMSQAMLGAVRNEMRLSTIEFVDVGKGRARGVGNFLVIFYFFSIRHQCMHAFFKMDFVLLVYTRIGKYYYHVRTSSHCGGVPIRLLI